MGQRDVHISTDAIARATDARTGWLSTSLSYRENSDLDVLPPKPSNSPCRMFRTSFDTSPFPDFRTAPSSLRKKSGGKHSSIHKQRRQKRCTWLRQLKGVGLLWAVRALERRSGAIVDPAVHGIHPRCKARRSCRENPRLRHADVATVSPVLTARVVHALAHSRAPECRILESLDLRDLGSP